MDEHRKEIPGNRNNKLEVYISETMRNVVVTETTYLAVDQQALPLASVVEQFEREGSNHSGRDGSAPNPTQCQQNHHHGI